MLVLVRVSFLASEGRALFLFFVLPFHNNKLLVGLIPTDVALPKPRLDDHLLFVFLLLHRLCTQFLTQADSLSLKRR